MEEPAAAKRTDAAEAPTKMAEDVAMDEAPPDEAENQSGRSSDDDDAKPSDGGGATSNLAKFKAAQDLRIETMNLPPSGETTKPRAYSTGSASTTTSTSSSDAKTPVPPCSTGKKRRRRTAAQIDRKFPCTYPGCVKAYGSEGSLTQHQRLKHRGQGPSPAELAAQAGSAKLSSSLFLQLHRAGMSGSLGGSGSRNINIRPAGTDLSGRHSFDMTAALLPENDAVTNDFLLASAGETPHFGATRQGQLRARSNSMPVSFSASARALASQYTTPPPMTPSTKTYIMGSTRRSRAGTPRSTKPPLRRSKSRSKSESLNELMMPMLFAEDIHPPHMDRSISDSVGFGIGHLQASGLQYDWSGAIADAAQSLSPASSVEEAIDSDILSVLADCDTSDAGDATLDLVEPDDFDTGFTSADGSGSAKGDDWMNQHDAIYLTEHLEKMSMMQRSPRSPADTFSSSILESDCPVKLEFGTVKEDVTSLLPPFPSVSIDAFAVAQVDLSVEDALKFEVSGTQSESLPFDSASLGSANLADAIKQEEQQQKAAAAARELATLDAYGASEIDQVEFMDVDTASFGPLQWKHDKSKGASTVQSMYNSSLDSMNAYVHNSGKHSGVFEAFGESFALDVDYAMEEPRLSSPVLCRSDDLYP